MWKSNWKTDWKMSKEKWLLLLVCGIILLILSFPAGSRKDAATVVPEVEADSGQENNSGLAAVGSTKNQAVQDTEREYENLMEQRVKEILRNVEGVGQVDVMLTLKSSKEKVLRVDKEKTRSSTDEQDNIGGIRKSMSEDVKENTLLAGGSSSGEPVVEKELQPEIEGIVISAEGGSSAVVKTEISEAMEALFDIPAHKIKVLKRVD